MKVPRTKARRPSQARERVGRRDIGVDLWQYVRDGGQLKLVQETPTGPIFVPYATIGGYTLVDPSRKRVEPSLHTAIKHLRDIDLPLGIANTNDSQREIAAKAFQRGMATGRDALAAIVSCREFVSVGSFATLRNWGSQTNAPAKLYARRDGLELFVGRSGESVRRITLNDCIDLPVPVLPEVSI